MTTGSIGLGRILGIRIRVDWSWVLVFALVSWNLAAVFGQVHADWSTTLTLGVALVGALLLFASILAHEMAHALVAKARGIPVRSITLFLFGGVSNIEKEPDSPRTEFVMAAVGPIVSLAIGVALLLAAQGAGEWTMSAAQDPAEMLRQVGPVGTLLMWLGSINVFLGLFNLAPGFPLDGGRLVRASLWAATDDLKAATQWAAQLGRLIGWGLALAGIAMVFGARIPVFGTGAAGGLWLVLIGWFLNSAASQTYRQVLMRDALEDLAVQDLMRPDPPSISADATVENLVDDGLIGTDHTAFMVMDEGRFLGSVTIEDVRGLSRNLWPDTTVREIMSPVGDLATTRTDEDVMAALDRLVRQGIQQLPVMDDGRPAGILRRDDIARWLELRSDIA